MKSSVLGYDSAVLAKISRERGKEMIKEKYGALSNALLAMGWNDEMLACYELQKNDLIGAFGRAEFFFSPKDARRYGLTPEYWFLQRKNSKIEDWDWEFGSWMELGRTLYKAMPIWKRLLNRILHATVA